MFTPELVYETESVALLAEGVDRNTQTKKSSPAGDRSPSSRRAWIEIKIFAIYDAISVVALLAEGVDRNILPVRYWM